MATQILKITDATGWIIPDYYTGCRSVTLKLEYGVPSVHCVLLRHSELRNVYLTDSHTIF